MRKIFLLLWLCPLFALSQSLSPERVAKIKSATVRVSIEGSRETGTAFFISASGELLTCWHVIEPALRRDSVGNLVRILPIYIQSADGTKTQVSIPAVFYQQLYLSARSNDYCLLSPVKPFTKTVIFFNPGNLSKVAEGQEVYTCGYPNGMAQPFISKGILSTKYIDSSTYIIKNGVEKKLNREVALLDLTLNKGNAGGPIITLGTTIADDEVIGIADLMITPFGQTAEEIQVISNAKSTTADTDDPGAAAMGIVLSSMKLVSSVINNSTHGISACLSLNQFLNDIKTLKK